MVVSEIGDAWSPYTAPARVAPIVTRNSGSDGGKIPSTIGKISAIVPQEVPIANPIKPETTKITAGKKVVRNQR